MVKTAPGLAGIALRLQSLNGDDMRFTIIIRGLLGAAVAFAAAAPASAQQPPTELAPIVVQGATLSAPPAKEPTTAAPASGRWARWHRRRWRS